MEYIDRLKDPINRALINLKNYNGPYEVTDLITTCIYVFSKLIEVEKGSKNPIYCERIYELLNKYDAILNRPLNKERREYYVVNCLRNGLVHWDGDFESYNGSIVRTLWKIIFKDKIRQTEEIIKFEFHVDDLKSFIFEVGEVITGNKY